MSLITSYQLANDETFQGRITMAMIKAAIAVRAENPLTVNHDNRTDLALTVIRQPRQWVEVFALGVTTNAAITDQSTDGDIEFTVNSLWDAYSNG